MTGRKKVAAPAARRPRKTAASAAEKVAAPAPDQRLPSTGADEQQGEIEFQGRTLRVRMPATEQLVVWRRIWQRLGKVHDSKLEGMTGLQVVELLEKVREIIDSVLVDPADVDWLDDEMLAGRVDMTQATKILAETVASFRNRQQRRAAKATGPARRKKV